MTDVPSIQAAQQRKACIRPGHDHYVSLRGSALIDVLIAAGALLLIAALLLPSVLDAREVSRRNDCSQRLGRVGQALLSYHDSAGHFPSAGDLPSSERPTSELSWHVDILGHLGYQFLLNEFDLTPGTYLGANKNNPHGLVRVTEYVCPAAASDRSVSFQDGVYNNPSYSTHYYGNMGPRGRSSSGHVYATSPHGPYAAQGVIIVGEVRALSDIHDGASNTLLVGELSWEDANCYRTWVRGVDGYPVAGSKNIRWSIVNYFFGDEDLDDGNAGGFNDVSLGSEHLGGTHLLRVDGSVRFASDIIDLTLLKKLASISADE